MRHLIEGFRKVELYDICLASVVDGHGKVLESNDKLGFTWSAPPIAMLGISKDMVAVTMSHDVAKDYVLHYVEQTDVNDTGL